MRTYEVMYVVRPNIEDEARKALVERFKGVLSSNGSEIIVSTISFELSLKMTKQLTNLIV